MKRALEYIGIISLFCFSFFYTNKAVSVVKEIDPIMIEIKENVNKYNKKSINAVVKGDEIIPGTNGCKIDINRSYEKMKRINAYNSKLLLFKEIKPSVTSTNMYDKYIVMGNVTENKISLIMNVLDNKNIDSILRVIKENEIAINFFVDGIFLEKNAVHIEKMKIGNEIYNSGYDGVYNKDTILWTNSLINNISSNKSIYCLNLNKNESILNLCSISKMYTIKPSIILNDSNYIIEKNNINKGNIVYFDSNNVKAFSNVINFLYKKGYRFTLLSELLSEKGC